ncbi:glycosyltransferase family 4 protein [Spirosoma koreense]
MKKIAFIVQRYGLEVNGGAEYHCRVLAERLKSVYEVDVLTSCAIEYQKWANHYPAGVIEINGVTVRRFPTVHERDDKNMSKATHKLRRTLPKQSKWLTFIENWGRNLRGQTIEFYKQLWAKSQGPYVAELLTYLEQNHEQYDALIFFTYLYYPTIEGLKIVPQKSILIPTAHDEPPIYLPVFRDLFSVPRAILYNSLSEKNFVNRTFHNEAVYSEIVGVGIEPEEPTTAQTPTDILGNNDPYVIYIGRIDTAKGCKIMFDYFIRYKKQHPSPLKLVLVGQAFMPIPEHADIVSMGFVEEDVKVTLLKGAKVLIMPSLYESLSMVTLESFSYGIPVIANANCEVLADHIEASQAGYSFKEYPDFERAMGQILTQDVSEMAQKAKAYVEQNYTWEQVIAKVDKAVDFIMKG